MRLTVIGRKIRGVVARPTARLELEAASVTPGAELGYVIVNESSSPLLFGAGYGFEQRIAGRWRSTSLRMAFAAWGKQLSAGMSSTRMFARVPAGFAPGRYRLTASVTVLHADGSPVRGPAGPRQIHFSRKFEVAAPNSADRRDGGGSAYR